MKLFTFTEKILGNFIFKTGVKNRYKNYTINKSDLIVDETKILDEKWF